MPYIEEHERVSIDVNLKPLFGDIQNVGQLNYVISRLVTNYLLTQGLKYANINAVAGVLQKVLAEFDERVTRPYEDLKISQNSDIPEYKQICDAVVQLQKGLQTPAGFAYRSGSVRDGN